MIQHELYVCLIFSQRAMLNLRRSKGMTREQASRLAQPKTKIHSLAQTWAVIPSKPLSSRIREVTSRSLTQEEIDEINPAYYTKRVDDI